MEHIWDTYNVWYKAALKDWHKGTGGGPDIDAALESLGEDKFDKYEINMETYNHTDVESRPIILFHNYCKGKIPWLTVNRMWDKVSDYLLCSRYDSLMIGSDEIGLEDENAINQ